MQKQYEKNPDHIDSQTPSIIKIPHKFPSVFGQHIITHNFFIGNRAIMVLEISKHG